MPVASDVVLQEAAGSSLPPLPHVLVELLRVCQDQAAGFQDMARVVSSDAVLASQLTSVANSAYYGRQGGAQTMERALLLLGTEQLKTIAITASVQQMCNGFKSVAPHFLKRFWNRSLRCALVSRALAHVTSYGSPEVAYLIGLLHNVGELVLAVNHGDAYLQLVLQADGDQLELENLTFNTNHCELGCYLAEHWGLDPLAGDAIAYHHAPLNQIADAHQLTKILYLAAKLAEEPAAASDDKAYLDLGGTEAAERLFNMSGALVREIAARVSSEVCRLSSALGIDLQSEDHRDFDTIREQLGQQLQRRIVNQEMSSLVGPPSGERTIEPEMISQAVNLMFGYRHTLLLRCIDDQSTLVFDTGAKSPGGIAIPLASSTSLVASSATSRDIKWSHIVPGTESTLTVVDRQLIRLCGANSIICAPVVADNRLLAVMVMGDSATSPPDSTSLTLLGDFAHHLAKTLSAQQEHENIPSADVLRMQEKVRAAVHEVNNPLAIIRNYLEALSSSAEPGADDTQYRILREEIDRAGQILMRLQDIEQDSNEDQQGKSVNLEIKSLISVFQQSICRSSGVECVLDLSAKLDETALPRNQLRQIITNLVKNAVESMPDGGRVRISTALAISSAKGKAVGITIEDSGPGLPDPVMSHLFQPGHTTKDGNHSGLGLSITRSLVEEIGGTITCQSSERGTQFTIMIPLG